MHIKHIYCLEKFVRDLRLRIFEAANEGRPENRVEGLTAVVLLIEACYLRESHLRKSQDGDLLARASKFALMMSNDDPEVAEISDSMFELGRLEHPVRDYFDISMVRFANACYQHLEVLGNIDRRFFSMAADLMNRE